VGAVDMVVALVILDNNEGCFVDMRTRRHVHKAALSFSGPGVESEMRWSSNSNKVSQPSHP
jgi:hypothetical protein